MRVALLTVVLAFGLAACIPQQEPAQNGRLAESSLTTVTPQCRVATDVADPLFHLLYAARLDGVALMPETQAYIGAASEPAAQRVVLPHLRDAAVVARLLLLLREVRDGRGPGHQRARLGTRRRLRGRRR